MNSLPTPDEDDPLEELTSRAADEFMEMLDRGETPDVEEVVARHPQIADVLRRLLPALQAMRESAAGPRMTLAVAPVAADPDRAGRLGDFEIVREVGRGGMGVVYEAMQVSLGRRVALKVLPFAAMLDPQRLQRFHNEARAAACLHHGNIVPIFAVGCDRSVHFYAMQYIEGRNLAVLIKDARLEAGLPAADGDPSADREGGAVAAQPAVGQVSNLPSSNGRLETCPTTRADAALSTQRPAEPDVSFHTAARLAVQAAEALHYAHQQGVVHRDVKPANVIVDATGRLWVTDFGLAQVQSDPRLTTTGAIVGTLRYMSPEQASGDQVVDHRTDVFSLGATLYELLALRPAFGGRDRATVLRRVVNDEPKPLRRFNPSIPADLETIVSKAMAKSPADRYSTAQALADDLRRFLEDKPILARRPSLLEKAAKWSRRRRRLVATVMAALFLAVCGLTLSTVLISCQKAETQKALDRVNEEKKEKESALDQLKKEEAQKDAALDAEGRERQRAEEAARKARQVLGIFTQLSEEEIPDKPELRPYRRKLLETALSYYRDFIEQESDDPAVKAEMVASKLRIASILEEIGQREDALAIFEQVRAELHASTPPGLPGVLGFLSGPGFSVSSLLLQPAVRQDLKLSPDQIKALAALTGKRLDRHDERPGDKGRDLIAALTGKRHDQPETHRDGDDDGDGDSAKEQACFEVLRPEQSKRLLQIVWQKRGAHVFADSDVADALCLAPDQRDRIRKIEEDSRRKMFSWKNLKHADDFWKDVSNHLRDVLTEEQKAKWKEMIGEPFLDEVHFSRDETHLSWTPPHGKK